MFKDLWTDLAAQVFNTDYGLFTTAAAGARHLYPCATALSLYNERDIEKMYHFLGY